MIPSVHLALVPLDERPVNTRYPEMLAQIAGATLSLPPAEIRGQQREPSNRAAVTKWLKEIAPSSSAAIVSCDYLGYGNLINSRITTETAVEILSYLTTLAELPVPVHAFSLITRVSNADDNVEEPLYWKDWGTKFYTYSGFAHRAMNGGGLNEQQLRAVGQMAAAIPAGLKSDWLVRRLRNHTVNLALIDLVGHGKIESLLLTSDDTSPWGFPSRERAWLKSWSDLVPDVSNRLSMHPGADEVGSALVANLIGRADPHRTTVWVEYAIEDDSGRIAPYEDRPVRETIRGQIEACGAEIAPNAAFADLILGVLTPSPSGKDYLPEFLANDRATRKRPYKQLFDKLSKFQKSGKSVMLADVAYPNGADPLAMEMLIKEDTSLVLGSLAAYGAWNTAGNTLGVVVAQGVCSRFIGEDSARTLAQELFLTHRFIEDWGYQTVIRREARRFAIERWERPEPDPDSYEELLTICSFIYGRLSEILVELQGKGVGAGLKLTPGSVRLPWKRTFEVDFDLEIL